MIFRNLFVVALFTSTVALAQTPPPAPVLPPPTTPVTPGGPNFTPAPVTGFNASPVGGFSQQPFTGFRTSPQVGPIFQVPPPATPNLVPPFAQNPIGGFNAEPLGGFTPVTPQVVPQPNVIAEPAPVSRFNATPVVPAFTNVPGIPATNLPPVVAPSPF